MFLYLFIIALIKQFKKEFKMLKIKVNKTLKVLGVKFSEEQDKFIITDEKTQEEMKKAQEKIDKTIKETK